MSGISSGLREPAANAWVTLATNDTYALGAIVLGHSLKRVQTRHEKCVMITDNVSQSMRELLETAFESTVVVSLLDSEDAYHLNILSRPELGVTFTKLHCWLQTAYEKCVFLDADTLVLENCDELFEREEFSAAPDVGWPDCFNSGVFVFKPNAETFGRLVTFALHTKSFDGGDQGLLNLFFKGWALEGPDKRLPFIYNMCSTACYSYIPAFKQFGGAAKIVHFIGPQKPWTFKIDLQTGKVNSASFSHLTQYLQEWWDLCIENAMPHLTTQMGGLPGMLSAMAIGDAVEGSAVAGRLEDHWRRTAWESSNADYMHRDSFDKVWEKIQETLEGPEQVAPGAELLGEVAAGSESVKQAETPTEDPKGAPLAETTSPAVATPPLPSALVDVDTSSASNLGSLAQTVSHAVAPLLSSLEPSLPPAASELDALTVSQVVTDEPSIALDPLAGGLLSAEVALSSIPADSAMPELLAEMPIAEPAIPVPALPETIVAKPAESQTTEQPAVPIPALPETILAKPVELQTTERPAAPIPALPESILAEPAESQTTEQPASPIQALSASDPLDLPAEMHAAEQAIPAVPNEPSALGEVQPVPIVEGEGPSVTGNPRLVPGPVPSEPLLPQPVPRTPTVIEATPPTSPPIGQVGAFPLASPAPALVGTALMKERAETAPASQSDDVAPVPPKRRGGPSKGGKFAKEKGKK